MVVGSMPLPRVSHCKLLEDLREAVGWAHPCAWGLQADPRSLRMPHTAEHGPCATTTEPVYHSY